ncbi:MAG TPA: HAMP domain-containing protein [Methylotenera sp.]|nr:HAMP domain-containing protein [Methylotenera sp.]
MMKFRVTQKLLSGYIVGFLLLLAFTGLILFNGKRIEANTFNLSNEKLPALITVSALKSGIQSQSNHLYSLYVTAEPLPFQKLHEDDVANQRTQLIAAEKIPEFAAHKEKFRDLDAKQMALTNEFVRVMKESTVDWDLAREVLARFSFGANLIQSELDLLVEEVNKSTLADAATSQYQTQQLMNAALLISCVLFIGVLLVAYFTHKNLAQPLKEVSATIRHIVSRRDLTSRLKIKSDDEVGDIALASNDLLEEFQRLARTLDGTAQEVIRTMNNLTDITAKTKNTMELRNHHLKKATQDFLAEIESSTSSTQLTQNSDLYKAQLKFIQAHLSEIDLSASANTHNVSLFEVNTTKLNELAEHMRSQIKLLNF